MKEYKKIITISFAVLVVIVVLGLGTFFINKWYHTRISEYTPQSKLTSCPSDKSIKGNAQSGIYHMPSGQYYEQTRPERCFSTEEEAKSAGYRKSNR